MDLTSVLIQAISGAIGGNAAGAAAKDSSLGPLWNSVAGALVGGVGGQLLNTVLGLGTATATSGIDVGTVVQRFLTGGVSGGITALVLGLLKAKFAGR